MDLTKHIRYPSYYPVLRCYTNVKQGVGDPTVPPVEPLFDSVIKTYYKLQELGIQEVDGKIVFIDNMEMEHE